MASISSRIFPFSSSSTASGRAPQVQKSLSNKLETVAFSFFHAKTTQILCQAAVPAISAGILHFFSLRLRLPQSVVMALTGCIAAAILGIQGLRSQEKLLFEISLAYTIIHNRIRDNNWWDEIDDHLIVGGIPLINDLDRLCDAGVEAVLVMLEDHEIDSEAIPPVSKQAWEAKGIVYKRIPAQDFLGVSVES